MLQPSLLFGLSKELYFVPGFIDVYVTHLHADYTDIVAINRAENDEYKNVRTLQVIIIQEHASNICFFLTCFVDRRWSFPKLLAQLQSLRYLFLRAT